jgi:hypothetical protein
MSYIEKVNMILHVSMDLDWFNDTFVKKIKKNIEKWGEHKLTEKQKEAIDNIYDMLSDRGYL